MAVKIGSARADEKGGITGGKSGDQKSGKEVSTQSWYKHSKGWRVFRPISAEHAAAIAKCMQMACDNDKIGYDQYGRSALYNDSKQYKFDVSKVTKATETDCSALVRVCCCYAGFDPGNFNTSSEPKALLNTGKFKELTGSKYTSSSDYLRAGDVLVTKTKGHTVVVITSGPKVESSVVVEVEDYKLGDRILKNGAEGKDVKELQSLLIQLGYDLGKWGADGDFGDATEIAVREFQKDAKIDVDGEVGPQTIKAIESALDDKVIENPKQVKIINGNCYVRSEPNTSGKIHATARKGEVFTYLNEVSEAGWLRLQYNKDIAGWVSGKYSELA